MLRALTVYGLAICYDAYLLEVTNNRNQLVVIGNAALTVCC